MGNMNSVTVTGKSFGKFQKALWANFLSIINGLYTNVANSM